jgi:uncharacterized protein YfaQ (DUF2300 family)
LPQRDTLAPPTAVPTPSVVPPPSAAPNAWSAVGAMGVARSGHTATLLNDGRVLVVGGNSTGGIVTSVEMFDPATGRWSPAAPLFDFTRTGHTATLLRDGRVLVAGGGVVGRSGDGGFITPQIYDPAVNSWAFAAPMADARSGHLAVTLRDGTVLVIGGNQEAESFAERYDPMADSWTSVGTFTEPIRGGIAATLLSDGQVLVVGGGGGAKPTSFEIAERYDPAMNRWSPVLPMTTPRTYPAVVTLPNGQVLVIGGSNVSDILATAERYDPVTDSWTPVAAMKTARAKPIATVLLDGRVLVTGEHTASYEGDPTLAEIYDPATNTWSEAGRPKEGRARQTMTLLRDGRVLMAGGELLSGSGGVWYASAEVYTPGVAVAPRPSATPAASPAAVRGDRVVTDSFLWINEGQRPDYVPQLSPDERRIAFFVAGGAPPANRLMVYDLASGATSELPNDVGALQASVRWSPDGRRLAYVRVVGDGKQGAASELVVTDENLGNPRVIYRHREAQEGGGPSFMATIWSGDGQRVRIGATIFGSFGEARWVGLDGASYVEPPPADRAMTCGFDKATPEQIVASSRTPDGRFVVCIVKVSAFGQPVTMPADSLALVRFDTKTGQQRVWTPIAGEPGLVAISPDGAWIVVGTVERMAGTSTGFERRLKLSVVSGDQSGGLRPLGGEPFDPVQFYGYGLIWTDDGRAFFVGRPVNGANHAWGYLYELNAANATVRTVTRDWETNGVMAVTGDGRRVLVVRGEATRPELHLIAVSPGGAAATPSASASPTPVPGEAVAAARGLVDARIAGDEARARSFLTPELAARLATGDLLPTGDDGWRDYRVVAVVRGADGRVQVAVQIYAQTAMLEQVMTLEERGGRWLVAELEATVRVR